MTLHGPAPELGYIVNTQNIKVRVVLMHWPSPDPKEIQVLSNKMFVPMSIIYYWYFD